MQNITLLKSKSCLLYPYLALICSKQREVKRDFRMSKYIPKARKSILCSCFFYNALVLTKGCFLVLHLKSFKALAFSPCADIVLTSVQKYLETCSFPLINWFLSHVELEPNRYLSRNITFVK